MVEHPSETITLEAILIFLLLHLLALLVRYVPLSFWLAADLGIFLSVYYSLLGDQQHPLKHGFKNDVIFVLKRVISLDYTVCCLINILYNILILTTRLCS
jgi:hypothetical protein